MDRLLIVGLDEPEYLEFKKRVSCPIIWYDMLPRIQLIQGKLHVERPDSAEQFVAVARIIFHGIFEDDFPFLTALALWGGPCLPNARGMMNCRQRIPGLVRALQVTRFGNMPRGYADNRTTMRTETETIAK